LHIKGGTIILNSELALKLFDGFSIRRWNDKIRPVNLLEMDRSGHKMMIAYFLGKIEEKEGKQIDWEAIIYGGLFDLLKKVVLSDIKEPVHRKIKEQYPKEFAELNKWVVDEYEDIIQNKDLLDKFYNYIEGKGDFDDLSYRILRAAHKYSTYREFKIIKNINCDTPEIRKIEKDLNSDIKEFLDLKGMQLLITKQKLYELIVKIEQLRYQIRWGQTPRIPKTAVLGHSMLVASLSFLFTKDITSSQSRIYNNFFGGLFHDLPEAVTRDIISPVKTATKNLPEVVKEVEMEFLNEELYPLMKDYIEKEIRYFTEDEFDNKIKVDGKIKKVDKIEPEYESEKFSPIDGKLIRTADLISAYLEAHQSIKFGIKSPHLKTGKENIYDKIIARENQYDLNLKTFLEGL